MHEVRNQLNALSAHFPGQLGLAYTLISQSPEPGIMNEVFDLACRLYRGELGGEPAVYQGVGLFLREMVCTAWSHYWVSFQSPERRG